MVYNRYYHFANLNQTRARYDVLNIHPHIYILSDIERLRCIHVMLYIFARVGQLTWRQIVLDYL